MIRKNMPSGGQASSTVTGLEAAEKTFSVALLLAASGGFLDAFTYLGHGGVFANAMTGNVVLLGVSAASGAWSQSLRHVPPIAAFLVGVMLAQTIQLRHFRTLLPHPALTALTAEIIFLLIGGWLPRNYPDTPLVLGISFLAAFQSSTFRHAEKWVYNSTMTTGNIRIFAEAAFNMIFSNRDSEEFRRAKIFGTICISFLGGAILGGLCTSRLNNKALWVVGALLSWAWLKIALAWRRGVDPILRV